MRTTAKNTGKTAPTPSNIAPDIAFLANLSPELLHVIDAWPQLSDDTRQAILELVAS